MFTAGCSVKIAAYHTRFLPTGHQALHIMRISVILLSYNYAAYLSGAIASVLRQTHPAHELIIVDDGSSDASWDLLLQWQARHPEAIRLFSHPERVHCGLVASYRMALSKTSGELVAFMESDDEWKDTNLEEKARALEQHPEAGVAYADYAPFGLWRGIFYWQLYAWANRITTAHGQVFNALPVLLKRNVVASFSHFMARRQLLADLPFPRKSTKNFDWWVLAHLANITPFYFIPKRLTRWRIHTRSAAYGRITLDSLRALSVFLIDCYRSLQAQGGCTPALAKKIREAFYYIKAFQTGRHAYVFKMMRRYPLATLRFFVHILLRNCLFPERALDLNDDSSPSRS